MPRKGPDLRRSRHNPNTPDLPGPPAQTLTLRGQHSFVKPLASEPNPAPPPVSLDCRGKIGQTVYQLTRGWINHYEHAPEKMLQRRRHVMPFDPQTFLQLLNRCRFAAAVQGWKLLTDLDRREYNRQGNARDNRIEGLNVWIRQFVQDHDIHEFEAEATLRQAQLTIPISIPTFIGITLAAPRLGDTMRVRQSNGPTLDQLNISALGALINNIIITLTAPDSTLIAISQTTFGGIGLGEEVTTRIERNGSPQTGSVVRAISNGANGEITLVGHCTVSLSSGPEQYKIRAFSSGGTADILAGRASLFIVQAP